MAFQHHYRRGTLYRLKHHFRIGLRTATIVTLLGSSAAFGQDSTEQSRQFTAKAGEIVLEAQNFITAEQNKEALGKLAEALIITDLNAYERSTIYQMQGAAYYDLEQYAPAIAAFEQAINTGGLLPKEVDNLNANIAQILIQNGQFAKGAQRLEDYLNNGGVQNPKYIEVLTQAWVQSKNYGRALPWAKKWYDAARPKERKHFDLLNFLYSQLKQPEHQADIVKQMLERWPQDKDLWQAWASLLGESGSDQDAFEVTKLHYLSGGLTEEPDLMKVIQYYSFYEMPYQAAGILEKEMNAGRITRTPENLEQLATLFRQAREYKRAIPILKAAAQASGKKEIYAQLGEALYNEGQCHDAEAAFKSAIDKGYEAGKAWMLIGTCRYEAVQEKERLTCEMTKSQKDGAPISQVRQAAIEAFRNVPRTSGQGGDAQKWISFIKGERQIFDKTCNFIEKIRIGRCFSEIARAKENIFIDGKLVLADPTCIEYIDEYNKEYSNSRAG